MPYDGALVPASRIAISKKHSVNLSAEIGTKGKSQTDGSETINVGENEETRSNNSAGAEE
jgi:hypothetical protein